MEHHVEDFKVSTAELADLLRPVFEGGHETKMGVARRSGIDATVIRRILRGDSLGTTSRVAERLLHAVGLDLSDLPSYFDEGWGDQYRAEVRRRIAEADRPRGWSHGTQYGYAKGCRCCECRKHANSRPRRPKPPKRRHVHPVLDALRGSAPRTPLPGSPTPFATVL